jgi:branched-chain amino acid transport system permease protein
MDTTPTKTAPVKTPPAEGALHSVLPEGGVISAKFLANVLVWVLLATMPYWLNAVGGYTDLGTEILIMALAAMSLNFLLGFTGVLSFGHAAYFGLGAYGMGMTIKYLLPSTMAGMGVGIVVAIAAAALIGALIVHLRGIYFAMVTIAFGQVFYFITYRWNSVTGGDDGLSGWNRQPINLGFTTVNIVHNETALYYVAFVFFAIAVAIMAALLRSPFGRTLLAIRENERRARFLGIPVDRHIWISWLISCTFVSLAGTLYALLDNFADPHFLYWQQSGVFVIMAVLGGMRSFWGPLLGAAIYVVLQDYVSSMTENWMTFIGLFFVLIVLFFPRGVLGMIRRKAAS